MFSRAIGGLFAAVFVLLPSLVLAASAADDIQIQDPRVRAVPPVIENSAMFVTLTNTGSVDHALVAAKSDVAKVVELHTHTNDGGVMRMRRIDQIDISANGQTALQPGGLHIMLIGLTRSLKPGDQAQVELTFEDGSSQSITAPVVKVGRPAGGMKCGQGKCGHGKCGGGKCGAAMKMGQPAKSDMAIFVNLTSDDDWRAGMALGWLSKVEGGLRDATVWLNVEGVRLAVASIEHAQNPQLGKSAQDVLRELIAAGVKVYVCPMCLNRAGYKPADLIEGAEMGSPAKVMPRMTAPRTRVLSW